MRQNTNYLLGAGERLTVPIAAIPRMPGRTEPYSPSEAKARLAPKAATLARAVDALPDGACPHDEAVGSIILHPQYLAKSSFPDQALRAANLTPIGSKARVVTPEKVGRKSDPRPETTSQVFVAGTREAFHRLSDIMSSELRVSEAATAQMPSLEDLMPLTAEDRVRPILTDERAPALEVVLHASADPRSHYILEAFRAYALTFGVAVDLDRRMHVEGLCFLPVHVPQEVVYSLAKFAYLRVARMMPRLRQLRPPVRMTPGLEFSVDLPQGAAIDPDIRAAIFDGGIPEVSCVSPWATLRETAGTNAAQEDFIEHGTGVTSAALFGPLNSRDMVKTPYFNVDHYRVLDGSENDFELFDVITRIEQVLKTTRYDFVNISLGPCRPIEDDDPSLWTSKLDDIFSDGKTLAFVAVGNDGEKDRASGNARIQPPSDCVNALGIGAADCRRPDWRRASYSCPGPGRTTGFVKPDFLTFGGSDIEMFNVLSPLVEARATGQIGTSFASPYAMHTAGGVRAHLGPELQPLAIRALMVHRSGSNGEDQSDIGHGLVDVDLASLLTCEDDTAHVVYQGTIDPAKYIRMTVPTPAAPLVGRVELSVTLCYATPIDPQDMIHYTRAGIEVFFRPNRDNFAHDQATNPVTVPLVGKGLFTSEQEMRTDMHKWETTIKVERRFLGRTLNDPMIELHYNAREGGRPTSGASAIPYAMIVTLRAPRMRTLYNGVLNRYRSVLQPLVPRVELPIRIR